MGLVDPLQYRWQFYLSNLITLWLLDFHFSTRLCTPKLNYTESDTCLAVSVPHVHMVHCGFDFMFTYNMSAFWSQSLFYFLLNWSQSHKGNLVQIWLLTCSKFIHSLPCSLVLAHYVTWLVTLCRLSSFRFWNSLFMFYISWSRNSIKYLLVLNYRYL